MVADQCLIHQAACVKMTSRLRGRIRFRCSRKGACKLLLKIFVTKYFAALKIIETLVALSPFTSRTASPRSSLNTRGQPRYVHIDLISGSNISISSRIRVVFRVGVNSGIEWELSSIPDSIPGIGIEKKGIELELTINARN